MSSTSRWSSRAPTSRRSRKASPACSRAGRSPTSSSTTPEQSATRSPPSTRASTSPGSTWPSNLDRRIDGGRHHRRAADRGRRRQRRRDPADRTAASARGDYLFDADVTAGGTTVTFTNSSDNQFHHVALMDFGTNDPAARRGRTCRRSWRARRTHRRPRASTWSRSTPISPSSPVFGPGSSGTFEATVRGGAHLRRAVLHPGPRGWPAPRHPAPDVSTCSRSAPADSDGISAGDRRYGPRPRCTGSCCARAGSPSPSSSSRRSW